VLAERVRLVAPMTPTTDTLADGKRAFAAPALGPASCAAVCASCAAERRSFGTKKLVNCHFPRATRAAARSRVLAMTPTELDI
jgi:hypothetical protein